MSATDACSAYDWLFIVSAGRSGSTTLLHMLNAVPTIFLSGENIDVLPQMADVYHKSVGLGLKSKANIQFRSGQGLSSDGLPVTSYFNAPNETALRYLVCSWVLNMLPMPSAAVKPACMHQRCFRGFKELWGHGGLDLLPAIHKFFPGAHIINNFRGVAGGLSASSAAIVQANVWATSESIAVVKNYSWRFGQRWLDVRLEELTSPRTFDEVLRWLRVRNCSFSRVVHANNGALGKAQWQAVPSTDGVLTGRCTRAQLT